MSQPMKSFLEPSHFSTYNNVSEFDITNDHSLEDSDQKRNLMRKLSFRDSFGEIPTDYTDDASDPFTEIFALAKRKMTNDTPLVDQIPTQPHPIFDSEHSQESDVAVSDFLSHHPKMSILTPPRHKFDVEDLPNSQPVSRSYENDDKMEEELQDLDIPNDLRRETSLMERLNTFDVNLPCKEPSESFRPKFKLNVDINGHFKHTDSPNSCLVKNLSDKSNWSFGSPEKRYNNSSLNTCKNLRDPDLRTITPETLTELIENPQGRKFLVIDCRYPYEYQGGHVRGAINITSPDDLEKLLIKNRHLLCKEDTLEQLKRDWKGTLLRARLRPHEESTLDDVPPILIFHCEFSQKRGPRALRKLRSIDRNINYSNWPNLYYPEVYVLENGYKHFHTKYPNHCNPINQYIRMADKTYKPSYIEAKAHDRKVWKKKESSQDDSPGLVPLHRFKTMSCI